MPRHILTAEVRSGHSMRWFTCGGLLSTHTYAHSGEWRINHGTLSYPPSSCIMCVYIFIFTCSHRYYNSLTYPYSSPLSVVELPTTSFWRASGQLCVGDELTTWGSRGLFRKHHFSHTYTSCAITSAVQTNLPTSSIRGSRQLVCIGRRTVWHVLYVAQHNYV